MEEFEGKSNVKLAGIIRAPLFIAPYTIPATLSAAFGSGISRFDLGSPRPLIQTPYNLPGGSTAEFYEAINPYPFDFGHWKRDPSAVGTWPGASTSAVSPTSDGLNLYGYSVNPGSFPTSQPTLTIYSGGVPVQGGIAGGANVVTNTPFGILNTFVNGFIANPGSPLQGGWYIQPQTKVLQSVKGLGVYFNAYGGPINVDFLDIYGDPGWLFFAYSGGLGLSFISTATKDVVYIPPGTSFPYGGYLPSNIMVSGAGGSGAPANILSPISITFDSPYAALVDSMQNNSPGVGCSGSPNSGGYLLGVSATSLFAGQNFTPVMVDCKNQLFYAMQFTPFSAAAQLALSDVSGGLPSFAYDNLLGVWYLTSTSGTLKSNIFHTYGINVPGFAQVLDKAVPFVLPCFNPCDAYILKG